MNRALQADWFQAYEQRQRDEWLERQPQLQEFRATPEEIRAKAEENAVAIMEIEDGKWLMPDRTNFPLWAECLARTTREGLRFERWRYSGE